MNKTMSDFKTNMCDYVCSGHALLHVDTFEKDRAISEIADVAEATDRKVHIWSIAQGWTDVNGTSVCNVKETAPVEDQLRAILDFPEGVICVLRDFGGYLKHETYPGYDIVIGWLDELRRIVASVRQTIVFVGPDFDVPKPLLHDITQIDFALPGNDQINERIGFVCSDVTKADGTKFKPNKDMIPQIVDACRGMTSQQTVDRVALALRKHKDLNPDAVRTIVREKAGVIRASGLLTYVEPPKGGLSIVGGYDALKQHVLLDQPCFTHEAQEFGIEFPRGLMLVGIPGCGKTLLSLAIASELGLPLIAMDVGNLMDKFVGESEKNMREAIKMLESIAPCVLMLDEIEKGFGGAGDMDGGASRRVFGSFIKWLNDRSSPVYAVATANQVQSLPPEFCRKGRFDEIYGLDLPTITERQEIFCIHLSKRGREPKSFDLEAMAKATDGYTGADIEQIIKLGLKMAFAEGGQLEQKHLDRAVPEIIPLSKTEAQRIADTKQWCERHAKPANPPKKSPPPKIGGRKVSLG
jgi:ATP-dependent 26S proteasome regulatory subunit